MPLQINKAGFRAGLLLLVCAATVAAQERAFDPLPPGKVAFNWPAPPKEGAADYFAIARDGQSRCVIVYPSGNDALRTTATRLQSYLKLVTGADVRLLDDSQEIPGGMRAIHVGATAVAKKTPLNLPDVRYGDDPPLPNMSGFLVKTVDPQTLLIRGMTDDASAYGVAGFLDRYVGVRQYWPGRPGALGEVVPNRPTLTLPEIEWRDWPYFYSHRIGFYPQPAGDHAGTFAFKYRDSVLPAGENYTRWLPPAKYAKDHPEYYPLIGGTRRVPAPEDTRDTGWQPCVSNPEVAQVMAQGVMEYFRNNPGAPGINFSINDGGADCTCAACRAMDAPGTDYSSLAGMGDRYVKFTNRVCEIVRKEFPDKIIVYLAYAGAQSAPRTVKLDPMILPVLTVGNGSAFAAWDSWMKTGARQMGLYVHHDDSVAFVLPKVDPHRTAGKILYIVGSGRARIYTMESFATWPISGLTAFVARELTWDPRQNVDVVINRYCKGLFRSAAEPMKRFYAALESGTVRWEQEVGAPHWFGKDVSPYKDARSPEQYRVLTQEEAGRAAAALTEAEAAAGTDALSAERIKVVRLAFTLEALAARQYWAAEGLRTRAIASEAGARAAIEQAQSVLALGRQAADYIANVLEKPPADAYMLFRRDPRFSPNPSYEALKSPTPAPEYVAAISNGVEAVTIFLRANMGPEKAAAWWQSVRAVEKDPILRSVMDTAVSRAKGVEIRNLLADPGFEELGKRLGPGELAPEQAAVLTPEQVKNAGVYLWFPERSPYRVLLDKRSAHAGLFSLTLESCHRARVTRAVPAEPNARFRVGVWVRRNAATATYTMSVLCRNKEKKDRELASVKMPAAATEWQELAVDVAAPDDATLLLLNVYANQEAGASLGLDDFFIGRYPR